MNEIQELQCASFTKTLFIIYNNSMGQVSSFYGLVIYLYPDDHNPPHIHVFFKDLESCLFIADGEYYKGDKLKHGEMKKMKKWISLHRTELFEMWNTQHVIKLEPLK